MEALQARFNEMHEARELAQHPHQPLRSPRRNHDTTPQVERLVSVVSGSRYVFFSIAATVVAVAATYQSVLTQRAAPPPPASDDAKENVSIAIVELTIWRQFMKELLSSKLSSMIVLHFFFVVLYHVFLGVSRACFGAIRRPEIQQTKEVILHFFLMRSLLLASTIGSAQSKPPVEMLLIWLSSLAFLRGILSIGNARFDYLLTRPMTRPAEFHRLSLSLGAILIVNMLVAVLATYGGVFTSTVVHLTWFEASLLGIKVLQLGTKVVFHVFDIGNVAENGLEKGELYLLLLQTGLSGAHLIQLVGYYLYIISVDHFRVSFLDLILIVNVKTATVELLEKVKQVQTYQRVVVELDQLFPDASKPELDAARDDVCVICLKSMDDHAKKLPCGHLFHRFCLRQCLQKVSVGDAFASPDPATRARPGAEGDAAVHSGIHRFRCPICRKSVGGDKLPEPVASASDIQQQPQPEDQPAPVPMATPVAQPQQQPRPDGENVLRISTEFLSRWLPFVPNLSFEIVRPPAAAPFVVDDDMIRRVGDVFPQFSADTIRRDLLRTRSAERTIERILSGRLQEQQDGGDGAADADGALENDLLWDWGTFWDVIRGNTVREQARPPHQPQQ